MANFRKSWLRHKRARLLDTRAKNESTLISSIAVRPTVSESGVSIAAIMKITALAAINLAMFAGVFTVLAVPVVLFFLVMLDLVVIQSAILGRPLRTAHYLFLILGLATSIAATVFVGGVLPAIVVTIQRWLVEHHTLPGAVSLAHALRTVRFSGGMELSMTVGVLTVCATAAISRSIARSMDRSDPSASLWIQRLTLFVQGAILGLAIYGLVLVFMQLLGWNPDGHAGGRLLLGLGAATFPIVGGTLVVSCRPRTDRQNDRQTPVEFGMTKCGDKP